MTELSKLIETHSSHNLSLREENKKMADKLNELLKEFESRESRIEMVILLTSTLHSFYIATRMGERTK